MVKKPGKAENFNSVVSDEETEKSIDERIGDAIVEAFRKTAARYDESGRLKAGPEGEEIPPEYELNKPVIEENGDRVTLVSTEERVVVDDNGQKAIHIHNTFEVVQAKSQSEPVKIYEDGLRSWTKEEFAQFMERSERQEAGVSTDDLPALDEEQEALYDIFCECRDRYRLENPHLSKMDGRSFMQ